MEPMPPEATTPAVTTIAREGVTTQVLTGEALAVLTADPQPTAGQRISRSGGQAGSALVFIELWQAFGWGGADGWTADQAAQRWPAITGAAIFTIAAVHNIVNWWVTQHRAKSA